MADFGAGLLTGFSEPFVTSSSVRVADFWEGVRTTL